MPPKSDNIVNLQEKQAWQVALTNLITDPLELFALLQLDLALLDGAFASAKQFPLKVPRSYVARMQKGNAADPLLRQILPVDRELDVISGYTLDPLQEAEVNPVPGLLHKYHGRVLVTLTGVCALHCRYCFRRHFPYDLNTPGKPGWQKILAYIQEDSSIKEVILSGGDPLVVSDRMLAQFGEQLALIPHVKTLRIHTRLPIVIPERVTETLLLALTQSKLQLVMVVHANHAQEINHEVKAALLQLREHGITVLNQTVLLKGINDHVDSLVHLSETLFSAQVLPYYLHVLDKVQGTAHFDIDRHEAIRLHQSLCQRLPGYLVPRLVYEQAGHYAKTIIGVR